MRIAVTRDDTKLAGLKRRAALLDIEIMSLPFLRVEPLDYKFPADAQLEQVNWLLFTSSQAVRLFFERLRKEGVLIPHGVKIAVVGSKTAALVCEQGHTVDMIPSTAGSKALFEELLSSHAKENETIIYVRAENVSFDPEPLFREKNIKYIPLICYRTIIEQIDSEKARLLTPADYILFTSPSTVRAYGDQFGFPQARSIALGKTTADQMKELDWEVFDEMKTANIDTVLENL